MGTTRSKVRRTSAISAAVGALLSVCTAIPFMNSLSGTDLSCARDAGFGTPSYCGFLDCMVGILDGRTDFMLSRTPADIAAKSAKALRQRAESDAFRRDTFALPREAAREKAREVFRRYPKPAYMTEIESWRELPDGRVEFTMRRLPTAD